MPDTQDSPALVGTLHASGGAKVVVVNKLVGDFYAGPQGVQSPDQLLLDRQSQDQRNRLAAIRRVRADWIDGLLRQSLANVAKIELRLTREQSAVTLGINTIVQTPGQLPKAITSYTDITTIFDSFEQSLLILGGPGSGKTTLLLQLADELLRRAEEDPSHRIPVIFNLSSWAVRQRSLTAWMADEMNQRSDIPRGIAKEWISHDHIIPLLDGLDEVAPAHRLSCLEEINRFRSAQGFVPIAVCSRLQDYESLGEKLRLRSAVIVQQLDDTDVDSALAANDELGSLREAVKADTSFAEILRTPLMLWIAALAYRGAAGKIDTSAGPEAIRRRMFGAYLDAMFMRRGPLTRYSQKNMQRWLVRLADALARNRLTIFTLERLSPSFVPPGPVKVLSFFAVWLGVLLLYSAVCFLIAACGYGITGAILAVTNSKALNWNDQLGYAEIISLAAAIVLSPVAGFIAVFADLRTAEKVDLSFRAISRRIWPTIRFTLVFYFLLKFTSLIITLINGNGLEEADGNAFWFTNAFGQGHGNLSWHTLISYFAADFHPRYLLSPTSVIFTTLICGIFRLFLTEASDMRSRCNQGTRRTIKLASIASGLFLMVGVLTALKDGLMNWIFLASLMGGLAGGIFVMRHFVMRAVLWAAGLGPLNYPAFLDRATERILLRRVGGGYVFVHRALQEYIATRTDLLSAK